MKNIKLKYLLIILFAGASFLIGCDGEEENFSFRPGDQLLIHGDAEAPVGSSMTFSVAGYTIKKQYTWTVTGAGASATSGSGEFLDVAFNQIGTFTISVSDGSTEGTVEVESYSKELTVSDTITVSEKLKADTIVLPLSVDANLVGKTTIDYSFSGTAIEGQDFEILSNNPLIINDSSVPEKERDSLYVTIRLLPDAETDNPDDNEKMIILGLDAVQSTISDEVVLNDDFLKTGIKLTDDLKQISVTDTDTVKFNSENPQVYDLDISLSSESSEEVTVNYTISGTGVGTDINDVTPNATTGALVFKPGETNKAVSIQFTSAAFDSDRNVSFKITSVSGLDEEVSLDTEADAKVFKIDVED